MHKSDPQRTLIINLLIIFVVWSILFGLSHWAQTSPAHFEQVYGQILFPWWANSISGITQFLSFDLASILEVITYSLLPLWLMIATIRLKTRWYFKTLFLLLRSASFISCILLIIQLTYGLNLLRQTPNQRFDIQSSISEQQRNDFLDYALFSSKSAVNSTGFNGAECSQLSKSAFEFNDHITRSQTNIIKSYGLTPTHNGRVKPLLISPLFQKLGIGGEYFWLTAEPRVNTHTAPLKMLFTMAHERAHLNGIAHENGADMLAYFTLIESSDAELNYVGWLMVWQALQSHPWYRAHINQLPAAFKKDWQCEQAWRAAQPERWKGLSQIFWNAYHQLFKANGIKDAKGSYQLAERHMIKLLVSRFETKSRLLERDKPNDGNETTESLNSGKLGSF